MILNVNLCFSSGLCCLFRSLAESLLPFLLAKLIIVLESSEGRLTNVEVGESVWHGARHQKVVPRAAGPGGAYAEAKKAERGRM